MAHRVTGIETEYGCLIESAEPPHPILSRIRDWLFENDRYGLVDLHDRDWDEPAGNGGFLFNGGRVYIDMGHLEYCTPECPSALETVLYDRAGDQLLLEATRALKLEQHVSFIRNNVDHYTGATFGCHENYSLQRNSPLTPRNVLSLLAFLTLRVLYCGSGRVGVRPPQFRSEVPRSFGVPFQISQRADFIQNDFFEWVQHNRAIINTRDEPLADPRRYRRLHLLHGDTNVLPSALFLKVGSTRLVLDLLEVNDLPAVELRDAVSVLRSLSRTLEPPWCVRLANDKSADALELLAIYQQRAKKHFAGRDEETDALIGLWERVLNGLSGHRESLVGLVDWVTKEHLFRRFTESEGIGWDDPWLESQDLEYHHIDPQRSLGLALADRNGYWEPKRPREALIKPPARSRAHARSRLMREIQGKGAYYVLDWEAIELPGHKPVRLLDPLQP
ncbi:MAG TPA: proteasome accessory factor PafA2 family protein [Methylomirabilota bacterium]|nr:proteasome accessory factor PafA2 family protein [Methylomirabilota bacterium]